MDHSQETLKIISDEIRRREETQDAQMQGLAIKASFLFTAGTATIGAAAAVVGTLLDRIAIDSRLLWALGVIAITAYVGLVASFALAYYVRTFMRVPDLSRLMEYKELPPGQAEHQIADGRRYAVETNDRILDRQALWVNGELVTLIIVVACIVIAVIAAAFS